MSAITNLSPNHLDHHKDLIEYYGSKFNIFKNQKKSDFLILKNDIKLSRLKIVPKKDINKKIKKQELYNTK